MIETYVIQVGTRVVTITSKLSPDKVKKYITDRYLGNNFTDEQLTAGIHLNVEMISGKIHIHVQREMF